MTTTKKTITKSKLKEAVRQLTEKVLLEYTDDAQVGKFAEKVDKFMTDELDGLEKLIKEGEGLVVGNTPPVYDYPSQERNQSVMARIGILKSLRGRLVQIIEDIHRNV